MIWQRIIIHHTASRDHDRLDLGSIRGYHMADPPTGRGWSDIGYHWVVERVANDFVAAMARPMYRTGSHCKNHNTGSIGVALVGDFSAEPPPEPQLHAAAELCAGLCRSLGLRSSEIYGHRDFRPTECPGLLLDVGRIRELVTQLRTGRWPRASDLAP